MIALNWLIQNWLFHTRVFKVWSPVHNRLITDNPFRVDEAPGCRALTNNSHVVQALKLLDGCSHGRLPLLAYSAQTFEADAIAWREGEQVHDDPQRFQTEMLVADQRVRNLGEIPRMATPNDQQLRGVHGRLH